MPANCCHSHPMDHAAHPTAVMRQRRLFMSASLLASASACAGAAALSTALHASPASPSTPGGPGGRLADGRWLARRAAVAFGTTVCVAAVHADAAQAGAGAQQALAAMLQIDRLMSLHRPDSQLSRLNRDGRLPQPDPHVLRVVEFSQALARLSDGAFDLTVQPLWELFSTAASGGRLPAAAEIAQARARVGWRHLRADPGLIAFDRPGMRLTANGVAQGYAADVALAALRAAGIDDALIDAGEFGGAGRPQADRPWTIGIAHPRRPGTTIATVALDGRFVSTSGDYATRFTPDFRHHHVFDPRTGLSPPALSAVTVAATSGLQADGLSTALMVLGPREGERLRAGLAGCDALWIDKQAVMTASAGLPVRRLA